MANRGRGPAGLFAFEEEKVEKESDFDLMLAGFLLLLASFSRPSFARTAATAFAFIPSPFPERSCRSNGGSDPICCRHSLENCHHRMILSIFKIS
jgi:hypothetical protein